MTKKKAKIIMSIINVEVIKSKAKKVFVLKEKIVKYKYQHQNFPSLVL